MGRLTIGHIKMNKMKTILPVYFIAGTQDVRHLSGDPAQNLLSVLKQALEAGITCFQFRDKGEHSLANQPIAQKALAQLQEITSNSKETEAQYEQASRLYQLLSGGNPKKIPLQQFILGIMLDDILTYANEFFSLLSRGRYSLRRLEGSAGGNAKSGLDLEVLDGFTGAPRSIETLSGGEQFLASLSLAFGLSDVVQSYSGSVRLDSIFIDEGFGSLDQDTLDTAMKALSQIQKMGRTVGIISHVSELKNRIATQIQVHPSKNGGSSITMIKDA